MCVEVLGTLLGWASLALFVKKNSCSCTFPCPCRQAFYEEHDQELNDDGSELDHHGGGGDVTYPVLQQTNSCSCGENADCNANALYNC